jgi:ParB/RepB/Spo0J family partition protein
MKSNLAEKPPTHSATREKAWRDEIHTPEAEYNANVPVDAIERDPANRVPAEADVAARAESIKSVGLLQPIVLRAIGAGKYRLMAGETRYLAFQLLKRKTIPARIYKDQSEVDAATKALVENAQRADLTPIERAKRFKQLEDLGLKQKEIGELAGGVSQPVIANAIRMLELPVDVQQMVDKGGLSEAHGVALVKWAKWERACLRIAKMATDHGYPAKTLAGEPLAFANQLIQDGIVERIQIKARGYYSDGLIYKLPRHLGSHRDFLITEHFAYYFLPENPKENVWSEHKAEQDAAHEKAEAAAEAKEAAKASSSGGKPSKEDIERQNKVKENKVSRAKVKAAMAAAVAALRTQPKGLLSRATQIVIEAALADGRNSDRIEEAAALLEIKLPKGEPGDGGYDNWRKLYLKYLYPLGDVVLVRLAALAVMLREAHDADRFAGDIPESIAHVGEGKLIGPETPVEGLTPEMRNSIERELNSSSRTNNQIGEMFGVPNDWVKAVRRDRETRELAGAERSAAKPAAVEQRELGLDVPATPAKAKPAKVKTSKVSKLPKVPKAKKTKGGRAIITDETRAMVLKLHRNEKTGPEIAKAVGISLPSVQNIKKQLGLVGRAA